MIAINLPASSLLGLVEVPKDHHAASNERQPEASTHRDGIAIWSKCEAVYHLNLSPVSCLFAGLQFEQVQFLIHASGNEPLAVGGKRKFATKPSKSIDGELGLARG